MGAKMMEIVTIGLIGALTYQILRAMRHKEMAAMVQIVCYALAATNALNITLKIWEKINSSPLVKLITKLGGK